MGATFDLTLDTRAPVVTWGAVGGATAGELLEVLYTTDEPLAFAKLWLPDGRKLDMTIEADRLSVLLPADTPNGVSWIHASDDVLNEAPRQAVNIAGVIIVPPPEPPQVPGPPQRARPSIHPDRVETRTRRSRSRGVARSRASTSRSPRRARTGAISTSRSMILRSRTMKSRPGEVRSAARTSVTLSHGTHGWGSSSAVTHRRDGPGEEEAMLLLGIL
jgi:hypothetical protein